MTTWFLDCVQFPRLLSEICAVGLTDAQRSELCSSMDLRPEELDELFDRALETWECLKDLNRRKS